MNHQNHPALSNLLGCHFHQDWIDEFPDDESALAAIRQSEPREQIVNACAEISAILASDRSDAAIADLLHGELGCYFEPNSRSLTARAWLANVLGRFADNC